MKIRVLPCALSLAAVLLLSACGEEASPASSGGAVSPRISESASIAAESSSAPESSLPPVVSEPLDQTAVDIPGFVEAHIDIRADTGKSEYTLRGNEGTSDVNGVSCYSVGVGRTWDGEFTAGFWYYVKEDYTAIYRFDVSSKELTEIWHEESSGE